MIDTTAGLQFEIRRLRDIVEKQYLEIAWQQSELRSRGGKAKIFKFGAGDLAHANLTGNAGLLRETVELPPQDVWPTGATPANPLIPNCGFASYASGRDRIAATGISVCGLDEQSVEHIAGMVEERLRRVRNFRPVFLMDITRTAIFRRRGFAYEYLAPCDEREKRHAARLAAFNGRRVEFIMRKWDISGIINFGPKVVNPTGSRHSTIASSRSQKAINSAVDQMINQSTETGRASLPARVA